MNRSDLLTVLEQVKPALADNNLVQVFQCFVFNQETVMAYNDSIGLTAPCELGNKPFAVHGPTLYGLLSNLQCDEVEFNVEKENVVVTADRNISKFPHLNEDAFLFEEPNDKWEIKIKFDADFITGLNICLDTSAKEHDKRALLGVTLMPRGKNYALYSCDGDAVTRYSLAIRSEGSNEQQYLLPNAFCEALVKLWGNMAASDGVLQVSEGWVKASFSGGHKAYGRLLEIPEPLDHEDLIKKTIRGKQNALALPMGIQAALARARVLADPESQKTIMTVEDGKLKLNTTTYMGVIKDTLTIRGHQDVIAEVNASLVQRAIGHCSTMAIFDNCTVFREGEKILQVLSNMN